MIICPNCLHSIVDTDQHMVDGQNLCFVTLYTGFRPSTVMIGRGRRRNDNHPAVEKSNECTTNESGSGDSQKAIPEFDSNGNS